jgi:hypothetical protein
MEMKGRKCKEITSSNVASYTTKKALQEYSKTPIYPPKLQKLLLPKRTCQMAPKTTRENGEKGGRDGRNFGIVELH